VSIIKINEVIIKIFSPKYCRLKQTASIITAGQLKEVKLQGDQNYISNDGAEIIQLSRQGTSTVVELKPLQP